MPVIHGEIVSGLQVATRTVLNQMPFFIDLFPEFRDYYPGTINVLLEKDLVVRNADFKAEAVEWIKGFFEDFSFVRIKLEYEAFPEVSAHTANTTGMCKMKKEVDAVIYLPAQSPNRLKKNYVEIITTHIPVQYGDKVCLRFEKEFTGVVV